MTAFSDDLYSSCVVGTRTSEQLVELVKSLIKERFHLNRHHVACVLACPGKIYFGLHIDSWGQDVCAEITALSHAVISGETKFISLVAARYNGAPECEPEIISPCGACRQALVQYAPELLVIVPSKGSHLSVRLQDLLPHVYAAVGIDQ